MYIFLILVVIIIYFSLNKYEPFTQSTNILVDASNKINYDVIAKKQPVIEDMARIIGNKVSIMA